MNQTDFGKSLGLSFRGYTQRIAHDKEDWRISELIKASAYDGGRVRILLNDIYYDIKIKEDSDSKE